ncbi:MAG: squalene/phytoene synthase family protein, partial [Anaerolineae bacterium]|nr:squalene/phytoene synthase family protein [Anaerolineae bacterium]
EMAALWDNQGFHHNLSAAITKAASKQTYYTIRLLVDRNRTADAYRAYAYFRWLDDTLDNGMAESDERAAFVERQSALMDAICWGEKPRNLSVEEHMLIDLIGSDDAPDSGLQAYIRHMMAVMAFDADRRGRLISQRELDDYTQNLAVAVTEALHYYIGHDQFSPHDETRYLAVSAAHITHLLRDTYEDIEAGYYNIPYEYLKAHGITPHDVTSRPYRDWVKGRVQLARDYFRIGKDYLARVESGPCRLAGYAYMARFEGVLDAIEREGYQLRRAYGERKTLGGGLRMAGSLIALLLGNRPARNMLPVGNSY